MPTIISASCSWLTVEQASSSVVKTGAHMTCLLLVQRVLGSFACRYLFSDLIESRLLTTPISTTELLHVVVVLRCVHSELLLSTCSKFTVFSGAIDDLLAVELFRLHLLVSFAVRLCQVGFQG